MGGGGGGADSSTSSPAGANVHNVQCVLFLGQWPGSMVWLGQGGGQCGDVI